MRHLALPACICLLLATMLPGLAAVDTKAKVPLSALNGRSWTCQVTWVGLPGADKDYPVEATCVVSVKDGKLQIALKGASLATVAPITAPMTRYDDAYEINATVAGAISMVTSRGLEPKKPECVVVNGFLRDSGKRLDLSITYRMQTSVGFSLVGTLDAAGKTPAKR